MKFGIKFSTRGLAIVAFLSFCAVVFMLLAQSATGEKPHHFDQSIIEAMRDEAGAPVGPHWLVEFMRDTTSLGGWPLLTIFTVLIGAFMLVRRHYIHAAILVCAVVGQSFLVGVFKNYFERNRPDLDLHLMEATSYSFPSGHSASAAAIYLTLAAILSREVARRREKSFIVGVALLFTAIVGVSRVYLGVHYPTDVIAGWSFGAAWAALVLILARYFERRFRRGVE
jgi:undecaprenyl-diphosphatase